MDLYYSTTSPFVRKVDIFAIETGLEQQIRRLKTNPWQAEEKLISENPLSKIPTLITGEGLVLYDSTVICAYLDTLHSLEKLIPPQGEIRWQVLTLQSLADGILDAGILRFMEKKRVPAEQSKDWDNLQKNSIDRGLDNLEKTVPEWNDELNIGQITVASLLGWLDFRFSEENWRVNREYLSDWYQIFSERKSMLQTIPEE